MGHLDRLHAQRGSRMGEIGDGAEQTVLLGSHPVHFGLGRGDLLPQARRPSSLRASRSAGSLALPIDLETSLARRFNSSTCCWQALRRPSSSTTRPTSAQGAPVLAVLLDEFGVFNDKFAVEHGILSWAVGSRGPQNYTRSIRIIPPPGLTHRFCEAVAREPRTLYNSVARSRSAARTGDDAKWL